MKKEQIIADMTSFTGEAWKKLIPHLFQHYS